MFKELETLIQEKILNIAVSFAVIAGLLQVVSGTVMDFVLILLVAGVFWVAIWIEERKKGKANG